MVFPVADLTLVRHVRVADVNADGIDDAIVAMAGNANGVYVLLGRPSGFATRYDHYIDTGAIEPVHLRVRDVFGGEQPELMLLGLIGQVGHLSVFDGFGAPDYRDPVTRVLDDVVVAPSFVTSGQFSTNGVTQLIVGSLTDVYVSYLDDWNQASLTRTAFYSLNPPTDRPVFNEAFYAQAQLASPQDADGTDNLVLATNDRVYLFQNSGSNLNYGRQYFEPDGTEAAMRRAATADVNGDGCRDTVVAGSLTARLMELPCNGSDLIERRYDGRITQTDELADIAIGELDGRQGPDLAVIDVASVEFPNSRLEVHTNLFVTAPNLKSETVLVLPLSDGFHPITLAIGDFEGIGTARVWMFDAAGTSQCAEVVAGPISPELRLCDGGE